ncbi:MAG TPA: methyltransferase domain-containing protein, partial [Chloroflexota bacterium]
LLAVPRETFVPDIALEEVYRPSEAIVIKRLGGVSVSSASAPDVIATMLEQLDPQPGGRVLEIGAGSGYNAALLAHAVGPGGQVVTVDIDEDLVLAARAHLAEAGYRNVTVILADGALGHADAHGYDGIILTVASRDIAPAWWAQLARPQGRLVMPLALRGVQRCVGFSLATSSVETTGEYLVSQSLCTCSFIPLRGMLGMSAPRVPLDPQGRCWLSTPDDDLPLPAEEIGDLLAGPLTIRPTGVSVSPGELRQGLHLWLAMHQAHVYTVWGDWRIPDLFSQAERGLSRATVCLIDADRRAVVLLAWSDEDGRPFELKTLASPKGGPLVARLQDLLEGWVEAGRPGDAEAEIRAYAGGSGPHLAAGEVAIERPWTRFVVGWRQPPASFTV